MKVTSTRHDVSRYINTCLLLLVIAYPFVTHFTVVDNHLWPSLAMIYAMLGLLVLEALLDKKFIYFVISLAVLLGAIYFASQAKLVLQFYPVFIVGGLLVLFGKTLLPGKTPFITVLARLLGNRMSERRIHYTRVVTQLWVVIFLAMVLEAIFLATFASPYIWSLFTNIINYLIAISVFVMEFFFRAYYFRDEEKTGFMEFFNQVRKIKLQNVLQQEKS